MTSRFRPLFTSLLCLALACGDDDPAANSDDGGTGSSSSTTAPGSTGTSTTGAESTSTSAADESSTTADPTTGGEDPIEPLLWQTDCLAGNYDLLRIHPDLQCTAIEVPLAWDEPDGETIVVGAIRIPAATEERIGTFWTLDGGPGGSGLGYPLDEGWREEIRQAGWDIIVPPHRGTFSPYLTCSFDFATAACREELEEEWGDGEIWDAICLVPYNVSP